MDFVYLSFIKSLLKKHVKSNHLEEKFHCELCDYKAPGKGSVQRHLRNVHQTNTVTCQICNKRLKKEYLATHKKLMHDEQKPLYCCQLCPFQTIHRKGLKKHTENIHQKHKKEKFE